MLSATTTGKPMSANLVPIDGAMLEKAGADAEKLKDVRGLLAPFLRDSILALNYAAYAPRLRDALELDEHADDENERQELLERLEPPEDLPEHGTGLVARSHRPEDDGRRHGDQTARAPRHDDVGIHVYTDLVR